MNIHIYPFLPIGLLRPLCLLRTAPPQLQLPLVALYISVMSFTFTFIRSHAHDLMNIHCWRSTRCPVSSLCYCYLPHFISRTTSSVNVCLHRSPKYHHRYCVPVSHAHDFMSIHIYPCFAGDRYTWPRPRLDDQAYSFYNMLYACSVCDVHLQLPPVAL